VSVADVIYDVVESFVAKCEAEAELEMKIIKFPNIFFKRAVVDGSPIPRSRLWGHGDVARRGARLALCRAAFFDGLRNLVLCHG